MKIALFLVFSFLSLSKDSVFADDRLIRITCRKTPYYQLCVSAFQSDPRSASADVRTLGLITVDILEAKAKYALSLVEKMLKSAKDSETRKKLLYCRDAYKLGMLQADVTEAKGGIISGDYKFAVEAFTDAALDAQYCESGLSKSQLSDINNYLHDISMVGQSIVHILMRG